VLSVPVLEAAIRGTYLYDRDASDERDVDLSFGFHDIIVSRTLVCLLEFFIERFPGWDA
jgi:hypothetical protein